MFLRQIVNTILHHELRNLQRREIQKEYSGGHISIRIMDEIQQILLNMGVPCLDWCNVAFHFVPSISEERY